MSLSFECSYSTIIRFSSKKLKGRKWNRKLDILDHLPPLNEADFLED
jgi:hypothetical protein